MLRIETLDYRFGLFLNASCKINDEQNQEIDALCIAVMQRRVALDMILAEKGGLCVLFDNTCCTYIPDNVHSSNMTDAVNALRQLKEAQSQDYVKNTTDWFTWLFNGSWLQVLKRLLIGVGVFLILFCFFATCIIPCLKAIIKQMINTSLAAYVSIPLDLEPNDESEDENDENTTV